MFSFLRRTITPLIGPAVILGLGALAVSYWPELTGRVNRVRELRALVLILPFAPYAVFLICAAMGWRYNNAGVLFSSLALAASYFALSKLGPVNLSKTFLGPSVPASVSFLLPINLALFSLLAKRRVFSAAGFFAAALVSFQVFGIILFCPLEGSSFSAPLVALNDLWPELAKTLARVALVLGSFLHHGSILKLKNISTASAAMFALGFAFLLTRFVRSKRAMAAGFLGVLVAASLGVFAKAQAPSLMLYFLAAGFIFIVAEVEASFFMAYIDELTLLPGRRSLNETLASLGKRYAIAMIDVDHFKKFNDTWGHKTGDEVLKMIAARLREMSGGAKVFRYGGEEFTAIFAGKGAEDAMEHLEKYRRTIEDTPFVVRSKGRRKGRPEERGRVKDAGKRKVKVTVSIGVAEPGKGANSPKEVIKAADRALYKAKRSGRNRVVG